MAGATDERRRAVHARIDAERVASSSMEIGLGTSNGCCPTVGREDAFGTGNDGDGSPRERIAGYSANPRANGAEDCPWIVRDPSQARALIGRAFSRSGPRFP